jgi:phosphoserine phosphatase
LYSQDFGRIKTVAVGNCHNDLSMLKVVDMSFFVEKTNTLSDVWKRIAICSL